MSYAPAVQAYERIGYVGDDPVFLEGTFAHGSLYPANHPVDWLIDNTPLRDPLFHWAELCGVGEEFEAGWMIRELRRAANL